MVKFTESEAIFCNAGVSDHSPIIGCIQKPATRRSQFKFFNFWTEDPLFMQLVQNSWNIEVDGTPMYRVVSKLRNVKK